MKAQSETNRNQSSGSAKGVWRFLFRKYQFNLKHALIVLTLLSIPCGLVTNRWHTCRLESMAMGELEETWESASHQYGHYPDLGLIEKCCWKLQSVLGVELCPIVSLRLYRGEFQQDRNRAFLTPLANLSRLESLSIEGDSGTSTNITASDWEVVSGLVALKELAIANQSLPETTDFSSFLDLNNLSIQDCNFDDSMCQTINSPNLVRLKLRRTELSDLGLMTVATQERLEELEVAYANIDGSGFKDFASLETLKSLSLTNTGFKDQHVSYLSGCKVVSEIDFFNTEITSQGAAILANLPSLTNARFGEKQLTVAAADRFLSKQVALRHGRLVDLKRDENFFRFRGVDYEVDLENSFIVGYRDGPTIGYRIYVYCTNAYVPEFNQPAVFVSPVFKSLSQHEEPSDWRDLESCSFDFPKPGEKFGGFVHDGVQWFLNNISIQILERSRSEFKLTCSGIAGDQEFLLDAKLKFARIFSFENNAHVQFDKQTLLDRHQRRISELFDLAEFEQPKIHKESEYEKLRSKRWLVTFDLDPEKVSAVD